MRLVVAAAFAAFAVVAAAAASCTPTTPQHARLVDAPPTGDVATIVKARVDDAAAAGSSEKRRVLVYVGAAWCEPCQRFHTAAASGDLDGVIGGVDVVVFDLDRDRERLDAAGYASQMIPLFAVPRPDGSAGDKRIEGSIKGAAAVAEMTPRLQKLLE